MSRTRNSGTGDRRRSVAPNGQPLLTPTGRTRKCGSTDTEDGHECQQDVLVTRSHCENGHLCTTRPWRDRALRYHERRGQATSTQSTTLEIDDVVRPSAKKSSQPQLFSEPALADQKTGGGKEEKKKSKPFVPPKRSIDERISISYRLKHNVITLDMDGTAYDPWACCKKSDTSWVGSKKCRHIRQEVLDEVAALAAEKDASIAVLSWRGGGESSTRKWLEHIRFEVAAVFIPGSRDDICRYSGDKDATFGQVGFKVATIKALRRLGHVVVASFDDRTLVCNGIKAIGVEDVRQVPHLVTPLPHEYSAGYIGAPKPPPELKSKTSGSLFGRDDWWNKGSGSLIDRHRRQFDPMGELDDPFDSEELLDAYSNRRTRALSAYEEAMSAYDPYDPDFDPDELIEMSELLDDPDAPPLHLHEALDTDDFFLSDTRRSSKRRDSSW